jgi:membrane protein DedA with SNARE-associated domain
MTPLDPLWWFTLAASTLVSEDLACIAAGLLIQQGSISAVGGVSSCAVGIFVGDLGLWALGRASGTALSRWSLMRTRLASASSVAESRLARGAPLAIVASRFLPGSRLPLYVTAGVLRVPVSVFALWSGVAVLLWTPIIVLGSAGVLDLARFERTAAAWLDPRQVAVALGLLLLLRWRGAKKARHA